MTDSDLFKCNETELHQIARRQGLPPLSRAIPKEELIRIVTGECEHTQAQVAGTGYSRKVLEQYIEKHWGVVHSQLPGCTGKCTTYHCTEGRHAMCFQPNADLVQFSPESKP